MDINLNLSVPAIDKLLDIGVNLVLDPLTAKWRAQREVGANTIRAHGEAHIREILAVGEAKAALEAQKVLGVAEAPAVSASEIYDVMEERLLLLLDRRLENISSIVGRASRALPAGEVPDVEPDMAWTSSYSNAAQDISDENIQELWARTLAGEIASPGSTSIRTLGVLRDLDQPTALRFRRLCSIAVSFSVDGADFDHRVISVSGDASQNALQSYGVSYDDLNVLNEHGLVISDYNSWHGFGACVAMRNVEHFAQLEPRAFNRVESPGWRVPAPFSYQGAHWGLVPVTPPEDNRQFADFRIRGVALTRAGREISKVVELEPVPEYDEALSGYFAEKGLRMERVGKST